MRASIVMPVMVGMVAFATAVRAEGTGGTSLADGSAVSMAAIVTGQQVLLQQRDGALDFAGRDVVLASARTIAGYASEVAYLVVLDGSARIGRITAKAGQMLLIPPLGATVAVERFDARRLRDAWPATHRNADPAAAAALDRLVRRQQPGIALGRFERTNFNAAASGAAQAEPGRRAVVGDPSIRSIRFARDTALPTMVQQIVSEVAGALVTRDAAALSKFLDPVPFGAAGTEARLALATAMVAGRDWPALLEGAVIEPGADADQWWLRSRQGDTLVRLRPGDGFAFVAGVEVEGKR